VTSHTYQATKVCVRIEL